jgi:hypothetical protein
MNTEENHYWFPARKSGGWGWGVANNWQGTLVQVGYPVLSFVEFSYFMPRREAGIAISLFVALTIAFLVIHWAKGEPPSWKW